jgi:hypothetical protein
MFVATTDSSSLAPVGRRTLFGICSVLNGGAVKKVIFEFAHFLKIGDASKGSRIAQVQWQHPRIREQVRTGIDGLLGR